MATAHEKKLFTSTRQCEAPKLWKRNLTCHVMIADHKTSFSSNGQKEISPRKVEKTFKRPGLLTTGGKKIDTTAV